LLNIYALKELSASTIGVFVYLQPVIAIGFAILIGADELNLIKVLAIVLVFLGVYIVSSKRSRIREKS
jgi:drug/metabolite transporter (DMT)-like permease